MAEKTQEQIEEEKQREEQRQYALKNLDSSLWNYASPKLISNEQYGQLSKASENFYNATISQAPDQNVYEQLFLSQLEKEGGAITSPYLQNKSLEILQQSLLSVKVEDAIKYSGAKNIGENFKDKYVSELGEDQVKQVVGSAIQYQTDEKVKEILNLRQKQVSSGLEEILTEPKKEKKE